METKRINVRFSALVVIILLAAFSRLIPHMPNFSPLAAIGLFSAAYFTKKWQAFLIPIAATWLSDLFIINVVYKQNYPSFTWFYPGFYWQYGCYIIITFSAFFIFKKVNAQKIVIGALTSSAIFFLISNFGCFLGNDSYQQNMDGLISCYAAGIPFLKGTLIGNLFYSWVLFGSFSLLQQRYSVLKFVRS